MRMLMNAGLRRPAALLALLCLCLSTAFSQNGSRLDHVSITVENLEAEVGFFTRVLDFREVKRETWKGPEVARLFELPVRTASVEMVTLQLGDAQIQLMDFNVPANKGFSREFNRLTHSNDLWFQHLAIVVADMDEAYKRLSAEKVAHVSTAPQTLPDYLPAAAGIRAFYFRDPEGHNLELIWFPPGKGPDKWHESIGNKLFLGIDHTAIGISDTDNSLAFYSRLGLAPAGRSENYGPEQEHLNQVFGARLDIRGLHGAQGFGLEFLRYIAPPGGRYYPSNARPSDLLHYHTCLQVTDPEDPAFFPKERGVNKGPVVRINGKKRVLVRDPDGHAILLEER